MKTKNWNFDNSLQKYPPDHLKRFSQFDIRLVPKNQIALKYAFLVCSVFIKSWSR